MAEQYCTNCAAKLMPTMRICPACGGRSFSPTPPTLAAIAPTAPTSTAAKTTPTAVMHSPSPQAQTFVPAGHWQRFFAFLIDSFIVTLLAGFPLALSYLFALPKKSDIGLNIVTVLMILASIVVPYLYYTLLHGSSRRATFGKSAMGLVVVTVQGEQLSKMQAFIRVMLTALVPVCGLILLGLSVAGIAMQYKQELHPSLVVALVIGIVAIYVGPFLTLFFNPQHQTLFDLMCKTCVIKNPKP